MVPLLAFEVVAASTATVHEKCDQDTILHIFIYRITSPPKQAESLTQC